jgi:hypothetical protein
LWRLGGVDCISVIRDELTLFEQSFIDFGQQTTLLDRSAMQFEDYRSHDLRDVWERMSRSKAIEAKYKADVETKELCKSEAYAETSEVYDYIEIGTLRDDITKGMIVWAHSKVKDSW